MAIGWLLPAGSETASVFSMTSFSQRLAWYVLSSEVVFFTVTLAVISSPSAGALGDSTRSLISNLTGAGSLPPEIANVENPGTIAEYVVLLLVSPIRVDS